MTAIESSRLKRISLHRDHGHRFDLRKIVPGILEVNSTVSESGFVYQFSDEDIEKIAALEVDVLVRCGTGELKGGILNAARLGIISFHYGDNRMIRGRAPAGFWEWYLRWPKTGFVIQRLTEDPDRGDVLVRGFFRTQKGFLLNQALLYKKANNHLQDLLSRVGGSGRLPEAEPAYPYSGPMLGFPRIHQSLAALAPCWRKRVQRRPAMRVALTLSPQYNPGTFTILDPEDCRFPLLVRTSHSLGCSDEVQGNLAYLSRPMASGV